MVELGLVLSRVFGGTLVRDEDKDALVAYLFKHFGPDNDRFRPVLARPPGR